MQVFQFHMIEISNAWQVMGRANSTYKSEHLYSALYGTNHSKALKHGSHTFTCNKHAHRPLWPT